MYKSLLLLCFCSLYGAEIDDILNFFSKPKRNISITSDISNPFRDNRALNKSCIDLQNTSVEELESIPGVGRYYANRIYSYLEATGDIKLSDIAVRKEIVDLVKGKVCKQAKKKAKKTKKRRKQKRRLRIVLEAIIDNHVKISGRWYQIGDYVGGKKLEKIYQDSVQIGGRRYKFKESKPRGIDIQVINNQ